MNGDVSSRHVFLEVLVYLMQKVCWVSEEVVSLVNYYMPIDNYNTFLNIYRSAPYGTIIHFNLYPDTYKICGLLLFAYGFYKFVCRQKN